MAYSHTGRIIPAIWFRYDLSPITVKYTERRQPFYRFVTTVSRCPYVPLSLSLSLELFIYRLCLSSDLRYHRRDVHSGRHHRLLHIHSLWSLEENPDRENVMSCAHIHQSRLLFKPAKLLLTLATTGRLLSSFLIQIQTAFHLQTIQSTTVISFWVCRCFPCFTAILNSLTQPCVDEAVRKEPVFRQGFLIRRRECVVLYKRYSVTLICSSD